MGGELMISREKEGKKKEEKTKRNEDDKGEASQKKIENREGEWRSEEGYGKIEMREVGGLRE